MGVTLTDVLLFGKAQSDDVDNATLVIYRRNILRWSALGGYLDVIVKGVSPLVLPDAIANSLSYVKAFGGTEQRNLPDGYTQLEYIQSDGASYLIVPYRVNNKTVFYCRYNEVQNGPQQANAIFGVTRVPSSSAANNGILRLTGGTSFNRMGWGDNTSDSVITVDAPKEFDTWYEVLYDQNELYQDGTLYATSATPNDTEWEADYDLGIFARNSSSVTMFAIAKISSVWAKEDGEYKINLVPAKRNSDNVLGMYDLVSGQFLTNQGEGDFVAGTEAVPTPNAPIDIVSNNGVLKVKDSELPLEYKRLLDISTTGNVFYVSNVYLTGGDTLNFRVKMGIGGNAVGAFNNADANDNYSFYGSSQSASLYARYNGQTGGSLIYTNTLHDITISPTGVTGVRNPSSFTPSEFTCSIPFCIFATSPTGSPHSDATLYGSIVVTGSQNIKFIPCERVSDGAIGYYETYNGVFLENQGTGTPTTSGYDTSYMTLVYTDGTVETIEDTIGNTATAEMLLKVGDYQDVQSILDGAVTRNVGIKVLNGTENWQASGSSAYQFLTTDMSSGNFQTGLCTHFDIISNVANFGIRLGAENVRIYAYVTSQYATLSDWTTFLANQYAAGTPVIVIYPLETPTTESVAGQTLQVTDGDNILEITQASLTGLELEAKYQAAVSLTIQEVEDANLDPNVEVTIN